jgi:hypothetical protein
MRLKDLAAVRVRYGYRRLHVLLARGMDDQPQAPLPSLQAGRLIFTTQDEEEASKRGARAAARAERANAMLEHGLCGGSTG